MVAVLGSSPVVPHTLHANSHSCRGHLTNSPLAGLAPTMQGVGRLHRER